MLALHVNFRTTASHKQHPAVVGGASNDTNRIVRELLIDVVYTSYKMLLRPSVVDKLDNISVTETTCPT